MKSTPIILEKETKEKTFKLVRNCEYEKWGFQLEEVCDGRIICKVILFAR